MHQFKPFFFALLTLFGSTVLAAVALFGVTEVVLIIRHRTPYNHSFHILESYRSPYLYTRNERWNGQGLRRGGDISEVPGEGIFRILSYGDSIGYGYLVGEDEHYPARLEKLLNSTRPGYEVINTARGSCPTVYSFHFSKDLVRFKPQMVIVEVELLNDVSDEALTVITGRDDIGLPFSLRSSRYIIGEQGYPLPVVPIGFSGIERLRAYQILSQKFGNVLSRLFPNPLFQPNSASYYYNLGFDQFRLTPQRLDHGFNEMFVTLKAMERLSKKHGVQFLLIFVPSKFTFYKNQYQPFSLSILKKAEIKAKAMGIPHFSLFRFLETAGGSDLFFDFCHPTAGGYQVIAKALYNELTRGSEYRPK